MGSVSFGLVKVQLRSLRRMSSLTIRGHIPLQALWLNGHLHDEQRAGKSNGMLHTG
jgi:hypothetical protein